MMYAIYLRVSTNTQETDNQLETCANWCRTHQVSAKVFRETETGKHWHRPVLQQVMNGIRDGTFDGLVVWKIDRMSRSMVDFVMLFDEIVKANAALVEANGGLWVRKDDPMSRLLIYILAMFAEWEIATRRERTIAGLERARREGKRLGRKPVNVPMVEIVRAHNAGASIDELAKQYKVGRSTLFKYMRDWREPE